MNVQIQYLYDIARKPERRIIGLMSGTSLDGLDVALCRISGSGPDTSVILEAFATVPYTDELKADIRLIFAKEQINFKHLCLLNPYIGRLHGQMILDCLQAWGIQPDTIDCVASHGQTVYHAPKSQHRKEKFPNATLQIGDGDHIAAVTRLITFSDFRQKHVAHGGQGAPLAVYGDYFMFSNPNENRILLNVGGIANFTYLPADGDATNVFTTDTGPGNTLLDAYARQFLDKPYDEDGLLAASGTVNSVLLQALKTNTFFKAPFPKTTGPEVFNTDYVTDSQAKSQTQNVFNADLMATLVQFSAETIADAITRAVQEKETYVNAAPRTYRIYMSGGGVHNPVLTRTLQTLLPDFIFGRTNELGINGDAKEAVLFAVLANESLVGGRTAFGDREGVPSVTMGKVSFPE
jgi:anhydro-N-acetylmuramic acid kinase